jgi:hypothetical protein
MRYESEKEATSKAHSKWLSVVSPPIRAWQAFLPGPSGGRATTAEAAEAEFDHKGRGHLGHGLQSD